MRPTQRPTTWPQRTVSNEGLHETFACVSRSRPDAVALVSGRHTTTYAELDRTADAWAARLAAAGVAPGGHVPILLPRSPRLVTALLAVLKAGAAYALLDPDWPESRIREVIEELDAPLVVTDAMTGDAPPAWSPPAGPVSAPPGFRPVVVDGAAPCCVFFTSGTTGRPKGVLTPHEATARLFRPGTFARFTAETVIPLAAPVPWDAFSLELWAALLSGGTSLVVDEPYLSATSLRDGVSAHGVETAWLTSSLFNMIVDEDLDAFRGLRQVIIGGERLSAVHVGRFLRRHPSIVLLNGYGPVESTVFATTHRIVPADCERPGGIPLGRPVPGTQVYVLDDSRPCAAGETGEICVAGAGLALRYLGDPRLTAAKFTHEHLDGRDVRVYRTGDLGRFGEDGLLHFRGRADRQVKIRGHRVEPADVERQVERLLPGVRSCRVLARRDDAGNARELVAFCVPVRPGDPLTDAPATLRDALPAYQRPTAVSVAAFPVTAQGKLDERALLATVPDGTWADGDRHARDPAVRLVAEVFRAVLGRTAVPYDVPFPDLGGDSLGAGRVCARLSARTGRPVPVSRFHEHPTVTALAGWLRAAEPADAPATEPADGEVPLTPMQLVFLTRHLLDPAELTSHCLLTWVIEGDLDRTALESAIAAVHDRHEPLRAAYAADPRPAAQLVDVGAPPLEILGGRPSVEEAIGELRAEFAGELRPDAADVWRAALVPAGPVTVLGCVVHHIAFDGWSESVLAHELALSYNASATPPEPPSMLTAHRQYLARLASAGLDAQREWLRTELAAVPDLTWPAGPVRDAPAEPGVVEVPLTPAVVAGVDARAAEAGVSRFVVLLSHFARCLAEITGQDDFVVGVPVAQRHGPGLERAIGCHINTLCVRLRGAALRSGTDAVTETGRLFGRAFAAQDVPYVDVLRLADRHGSDRPPLFQTLFALQDNATPHLRLDGLRTTFVRQPYLALPLELHAELWPEEDGGLRLTVCFRPDAVPEATARRLADRFRATVSGALPCPR